MNSKLDSPKVVGRFTYRSANLLGLDISLLDTVAIDDDIIAFSQYGHQIILDSINGAFDSGFADDWELMTATILVNMLSLELKRECVVIEGVETIVERFGQDK